MTAVQCMSNLGARESQCRVYHTATLLHAVVTQITKEQQPDIINFCHSSKYHPESIVCSAEYRSVVQIQDFPILFYYNK